MSAQSIAGTVGSPYIKNLADRTFERLEVISFAGVRGTGIQHAYWTCRCECGTKQDIRGTKLLTGKMTQCAKCNTRDGRARREASMLALAIAGGTAFNVLFREYVYNAKAKNVTFSLSKDEAHQLFESDCWYCGEPPSALKRLKKSLTGYTHNGIDRVDSSLGYVTGNVVSCCRICNYAKRQLSVVDFLAWVERVHAHQQRRASS